MKRRSIFILLIVAVTIAIDQISKFWVRANIEVGSVSEIVGQKFILTNVYNEGAFLGMGSDLGPTLRVLLLLILPVVVLGVVAYHVVKEKNMDRLSLIAFSLIIGGGIGNIFDRFMAGKVTDFWRIDLGGIFKTGIFNIADIAVTTGMIMLLVAALVFKKKKEVQEA